MIVAHRYFIRGQVQGVGFRFFTEEAARREGLSGFARNLEDGRVEVLAEGDAEAVVRFERSIWLGPLLARVANVETEIELPVGTVGFKIRE